MEYTLHKGDLPADLKISDMVAVDTETTGLSPLRDRLCLVQLSFGDGHAHIVQMTEGMDCPNLKKLLSDQDITKIFHFARFDVMMIMKWLNVVCEPVYCTKIASKLVRTYTGYHGLKALLSELTNKDISKAQQSSDWAAQDLSDDQLKYAASDVLYLHELKEKLDVMLEREGRTAAAQYSFDYLPTRAWLDLTGFEDTDIFAHS